MVNADGSDYHTIVRHGLDAIKHPDVLDVFVIKPVWSPDAKNPRLAFTLQDVDHGVAIGAYIADANGSNVQALSGDAPADGPSWSSDGSHVAFATWSMQSTSLQSASVVMRTVCCGTELETISRLSNVSFKSPGGPSGFSRTIFIAHRSVRCTHLVFGSELSDLQIVKSNLPALPSPTHWVSAA